MGGHVSSRGSSGGGFIYYVVHANMSTKQVGSSWNVDIQCALQKRAFGRVKLYENQWKGQYRVTSLAQMMQAKVTQPLSLQSYTLLNMTTRQLSAVRKGPPYYNGWQIQRLASLLSLIHHSYFTTYIIKEIDCYMQEHYMDTYPISSYYINSISELRSEVRRFIKTHCWGPPYNEEFNLHAYFELGHWKPVDIMCDCLIMEHFEPVAYCEALNLSNEKQAIKLASTFYKSLKRQIYNHHYGLLNGLFSDYLYASDCTCHLKYFFRQPLL